MGLIVAGMLNKQITGELRASEATIKIHQAHVMQKMELSPWRILSEWLKNWRLPSRSCS
jgi:FixJ family two-component response regulator